MSTTKNKYNFYISYWESFNALSTDKEKVEFITLINKIHFFEEHIDKVKITNPNVKLLFTSIKHSLKASIQGYCDKKEIEYDSLFNTPCKGGSEGACEPPCQQLVINNKQLEIDNKKKEELLVIPKKNYAVEMINIWNEVCTNLKKVKQKKECRVKNLNNLVGNKDYLDDEGKPMFENMDDWKAYCEDVNSIPHLIGQNDRGWVADIDFCIEKRTKGGIIAVLEGKYNNKKV